MGNKKLLQEDLNRFNSIMGYNPSKGTINEEGEQMSMDFPIEDDGKTNVEEGVCPKCDVDMEQENGYSIPLYYCNECEQHYDDEGYRVPTNVRDIY